jgi:protein SCO1
MDRSNSPVNPPGRFGFRISDFGFRIFFPLILLTATVFAVFTFASLRAPSSQPLPVYGTIADFTLTNQNGRATTLADLRGHVWVADIIFTRCAGPCPKMTRQMEQIQQALPASSDARFVTLTTDPGFDSSSVLHAYAERFNADPSRWYFLTGSKTQIAALAVRSLKLTALEKQPSERESAEDLFIHSTIFVVVDKAGQLRGVYETSGEGIDPREVRARILADIRRLEREPT